MVFIGMPLIFACQTSRFIASDSEQLSRSIIEDATIKLAQIDISTETYRHVIIAKGSPNLYNGHPTTVMLDDNKTIFTVWTRGHGGTVEFLAKSEDGGLSWKNLPVPNDWITTSNCPSIYKLKDQSGKERLFIFAGSPNMSVTYSEDFGNTWSPVKSLNKPCVMAFTTIIQLKDGGYLGLYHRRGMNDQREDPLTIWASKSKDGGLTWSESLLVGQMEGRSPCEPFAFRSPDGNQLVCITRENQRVGPSFVMFSDDEGETWSEMRETTWELTGDRHIAKYVPDGRLVITFRDKMPESPYYDHFVVWVGRYEDILLNRTGQYRIKALHSYAGWDCGYPGLEIFPDNTVLATTYIKYEDNEDKHSIVSTRFNLSEIDRMALE
jgi:hypothetical protein